MVTEIIRFFFVISVCVGCLKADSLDDAKQKYLALIMECAKESPITADDVTQLKNKVMPESPSVRCLFACVYKKSGMMDDQGLLSVEGIHAITRKVYADDPSGMERAIQFTEACSSVNDAYVNDGAQGCDRAALIFKCTIDNAPQFNFAL